jgi:mRNA interferase RelE/StbE
MDGVEGLRGADYQVNLSPQAQLESTIDGLAKNPRPPGCRKMVSLVNKWRIRVGAYRVIYAIDDTARQVLIRRVGHRRDVYGS